MEKIFPIIIHPHPILRKKSAVIDPEEIKSGKFGRFCRAMAATMLKKDGIGLAAPQVGRNIRLIVVNKKDGFLCMVNPRLKRKSWSKEWNEEGCLSVPGVYGKVKRSKEVVCLYFDQQGEEKKIKARGLLAFVIQHEIDHLDGILFIDKAKDIKK